MFGSFKEHRYLRLENNKYMKNKIESEKTNINTRYKWKGIEYFAHDSIKFLKRDILPVNKITLWILRVIYIWIGVMVSVYYTESIIVPNIYAKYKERKLNPDANLIANYIKNENKRIPKTVTILIAKAVLEQSELYEIPVPIIMGIMKVESNYNPTARSSVGAGGLMQVFDGGSIQIDKTKVYDISYNIGKGLEILQEHLRIKKGNIDKALYGYVNKDSAYMGKVYKASIKYLFYSNKNK